MAVPSVQFDQRSTASNTQLEFLVPAHDDNTTAAVNVVIAGDATPVTAPPAGWVEQTAAYQSDPDVTVVTWTNNAGLAAADTSLTVQWTGTTRAAGVLAVSSNTTGISQVGAVDPNATYDSVGDHPGVTAVEDDEYLLVFGGTGDVGDSGERYPTTASPAALTDLVRTETVAAGIDAWVIHTPTGIPTGPTGPISYTLTGLGATSDPAPMVREGFATFGTGDADTAGPGTDVAWPVTPEVGWTGLVAVTGQPPDVDVSTPAVDATITADSAGVAVTSIDATVPAGHAGKTCVLELVVEGNAGAVTTPAGFTAGPSVAGVVHTASKVLDGTETDVSWTVGTSRVLAVRGYVVDGTITGVDVTHTLGNTAHPYGPHTAPQQTGSSTSLHLLTWASTTDTAVPSSTTDTHTITTHTQPAGHVYETGYGTVVPGAAGTNPTGTTTMSASTDAVTFSYIVDPRPVNPTNIDPPAGWEIVWSQPGVGDTPSSYVFARVFTEADVTAGQVTIDPSGGVGEYNGIIGVYSGGDPSAVIETAAATDGAAYSTVTSTPAAATSTLNTVEVAVVFATDHGAPSHADSVVSDATVTGMTEQAAVESPAGSTLWWFDLDRPTGDAGTTRAGTITNGLANEVNHQTVVFALKPADGNGSRQTTQAVTFAAATDGGPQIVWAAQPDCVTDPATVNGTATDSEGVGTVTVEIVRSSDGQYWDGAAWTGTPTQLAATLGTPGGTTTTFTLTPTGAFTTPGSYTVTVAATDNGAPTATRTRTQTWCVAGPTAIAVKREARLGCNPAGISVEVIGRHGGVAPDAIVARLPITATPDKLFDRRVDSPSEAEIECRLSPLDLQRCCPDFADIDTWANYVRITWDGQPETWVGVVTFVRHFTDGIYLKAHDLSVYWQVRNIGEHHHDQVDLATVFADYHRDAYQQDPWGMDVIAQPVGITGTRDVLASDGMIAWSAISELTRTGIDYTVIGRTMLIGGEEVPATPITTLRDDHFTEPLTVVDDGVLRATDYIVSGGDQITGRVAIPETSAQRRRYGLITGRTQERNILDESSAARAARTRLDFMQDSVRIEPPSNARLTASAPVQMVDLVPGARIDVASSATCKTVAGQFRLSRVTAHRDGTVAVSLQPLGTTGP